MGHLRCPEGHAAMALLCVQIGAVGGARIYMPATPKKFGEYKNMIHLFYEFSVDVGPTYPCQLCSKRIFLSFAKRSLNNHTNRHKHWYICNVVPITLPRS